MDDYTKKIGGTINSVLEILHEICSTKTVYRTFQKSSILQQMTSTFKIQNCRNIERMKKIQLDKITSFRYESHA